MQSAAMKIWSGDIRANVASAQAMVLERARDNGLAAMGRWSDG
jgi:fructose-bisphosphate aldolase class I